MRRVFVAQHPTEAHLVAGVLGGHGIESVIRGEALFSARGEAPVTSDTLPSVWVSDDDAPGALAILRAAQADERANGPCWRCLHCGEKVEPQFTACWRCNADRPGSASVL